MSHPTNRIRRISWRGAMVMALSVCCFFVSCHFQVPESARPAGRAPNIYPVYRQCAIPPNIAPLNFVIKEKGSRYNVMFSVDEKTVMTISSASPEIRIPEKKWEKLLSSVRGRRFGIAVSVLSDNQWVRFAAIENEVAQDSIDPYIVYRKISNSLTWLYMGMYQRAVGGFKEDLLMHNMENLACMNCHIFRNRNPSDMIVQLRAPGVGTPMVRGFSSNGRYSLESINTKTSFSHGKAGFTAWHPKKNIIVFSLNQFQMKINETGIETREVIDWGSDLALYDFDTREVVECPELALPDRYETMPEWTPDGTWLYFCGAPLLPNKPKDVPVVSFDSLRLDLMRVGYDTQTGAWGTPERVVSAHEAGGSVLQPRFSPDGKWLLLTITHHGDFPIHLKESDIWLLDAATLVRRKLDINSQWTEGWQTWSHNSRWIAFSTKADNGRFSRIAFSYIDSAGNARRPFLLPQKAPASYESCLLHFQKPEFVTGKLPYTNRQLQKVIPAPKPFRDHLRRKAIYSQSRPFNSRTKEDGISGATRPQNTQ